MTNGEYIFLKQKELQRLIYEFLQTAGIGADFGPVMLDGIKAEMLALSFEAALCRLNSREEPGAREGGEGSNGHSE